MSLIDHCPECGSSHIQEDQRDSEIRYKKRILIIKQMGLYCQDCGAVFLTPDEMVASEKVIVQFRRDVDTLLSPDEIKRIRISLGLSQVAAAELFGGGSQSFSKYERGLILHNKPLDYLLRLIDSGVLRLKDIVALSTSGLSGEMINTDSVINKDYLSKEIRQPTSTMINHEGSVVWEKDRPEITQDQYQTAILIA